MIFQRTFAIILQIILASQTVLTIDCGSNPKTRLGELRKSILCEYDKSLRPIKDASKPIIITLTMHLKSFSYDENQNRLTIYTWLPMSWTDEHLTWDRGNWDNIKDVLVSSQEIWTPDISLYNSDNGQSIQEHGEVNCETSNEGRISCVLPIEFTAHCKPNYVRWPYDVQSCTLYFGSWMSPAEHIDYNNKTLSINAKDCQPNHTWKILKAKAVKVSKTYSCCPNETYPTINFTFDLERHSGVMEVLFIFPAMFMIIANLLVLLMDASISGNRFILLCLNIVSHFLFVQHLTWLIPHNGDTVPNVLIFFRDSLLITMVVLIETVVIQAMETSQLGKPLWVENSLKTLSQNRVGNIFLFRMSYNGSVLKDEETQADDAILVTPKNKEVTTWMILANVINRLLFLVLFCVYFVMFWALLPNSY